MDRSVIGKCVRGASHRRKNTECQDSMKKLHLSDNTVIIAVADGHGSSACPYSKSGSLMAVNTFCRVMYDLHEAYLNAPDSLKTFFNREGEVFFAQTIEREWKKRVLQAHSGSKREIPYDEEGGKDRDAIFKQYGTTLLGVYIAQDYVFTFQLGDGDIMFINETTALPVGDAEKILGIETHSLCKKNAWKSACSGVFELGEVKMPCALMLSTDGFSNSFVNNEEFEKSCRGYFDLMQEHGTHVVELHLRQWLAETSENGCGDDITAVFAYIND